jgi:hypothetical protein
MEKLDCRVIPTARQIPALEATANERWRGCTVQVASSARKLLTRDSLPARIFPDHKIVKRSSAGRASIFENEFHFQDADAMLTVHAAKAHR